MTAVDAADRPTMAEALFEWRSSVAPALRPPPPPPLKQAPLSTAKPNRLPRAPTVTLVKQARQSVGVENENDAARVVAHRTQH
jgi:hypothetical protein